MQAQTESDGCKENNQVKYYVENGEGQCKNSHIKGVMRCYSALSN